MDVYVTLRFHHGGKLQQKPRIKYEGGIVTDCFDVDVDKLSYFEFVDIVKEIGYNCSAYVVYIKPPRCRHVVELKKMLCPPLPPPEIGYLNDVGGESNATFDKKSSQTFEGSEGLGIEEAAQPKEPIVGEELGEVLDRTSASAREDLGRAFAGKLDWESETEASDDSDNVDLSDEGEDEYGSDVHEEGPRSEGVDLGKKGVNLGYDKYLSKKQTTFEDTDEDVNEEDEVEQPIRRQRKSRRAKRNKKKVFREAITRYAVQEHVELDKYVNDATRVRVKCTTGCPWLLFGSIDSRMVDFVVKNYNPVHKCNGTTKNKLVNSKYLSESLVKKELNVYVGRTVARKARNIVLKQIMGDNVEEFKRILDYRDELLKTNPGSTCVVRLTEETFEGGRKMFQSFYICFDALKKAFKAGARRCIGFDGCFLKGVSRGQLLVAVCKDGNNKILPLAWAVVELVRHDLEQGDGTELTTITDMQKGLDKAIQDLLSNAEQRMCARHVLANWSKNWKGIERRNCFWRCAKSTYEE
ncbi:hypothetical protein KY290_017846 [Solanum tuberosum]|uniref:PB1-like domain-containing protein n=1 Tax=Solanum tuberosum TaxID=4113 RepID=A0ABQ7VDA1_SOLTU|nr:hypothetical protein KY290_017846 [Solanum tuberosum]